LSPGSAAFSVVIPTYRRRSSLEKVLHGLAGQQWPPDLLEAIVVSDGADDGSAELVRSFPAPFPLYLLEQANQGPAAARNLGLASARGPFVLFLDDDMQIGRDFLEQHLAAHGAGRAVVLGLKTDDQIRAANASLFAFLSAYRLSPDNWGYGIPHDQSGYAPDRRWWKDSAGNMVGQLAAGQFPDLWIPLSNNRSSAGSHSSVTAARNSLLEAPAGSGTFTMRSERPSTPPPG